MQTERLERYQSFREASKGDCSEPPTKIEIRAGACAESGVPFSPFDGPPNWTGTCSSEGGLSAGAMCGNEPCAQSVWASPLDAPTGDTCDVITKIPLSTKEHAWKTRAIACQATTDNSACGSKSRYCVAKPGPEWNACVWGEGGARKEPLLPPLHLSIHHILRTAR